MKFASESWRGDSSQASQTDRTVPGCSREAEKTLLATIKCWRFTPESCSASQFLAIKRCKNMIQMNEFYPVREQWHRVREIWDTCLERALHRLHCSHVPTTHMIFTGIVRCSSCNTLLRKKSPFHNSIILLVDVICFHPSINTFLVLFPFRERIVVLYNFDFHTSSFLCIS